MSDSLTSRILVGVIGILGILFLVYMGRFYFATFVTVVCILAVREFFLLARVKEVSPQFWVGALACALISILYYRGHIFSLNWQQVMVLLAIITVVFELLRKKQNATQNIAMTLGGIVYIPVLLGGLIGLRQIDLFDYDYAMRLTMSLFISVWTCDTAAFVFGKAWGKRKIMDKVSPQKTVVGGVAGFIAGIATYLILFGIGFLTAASHSSHAIDISDAVILGVIVGFLGQTGDFVESLIKRDMGVKDSSRFLPGHGGVLDRFDSLMVASPLTFLYLKLFVY